MQNILHKKFLSTLAGLICIGWFGWLVNSSTIDNNAKKELLDQCIWVVGLITAGYTGIQMYQDMKSGKVKNEETK